MSRMNSTNVTRKALKALAWRVDFTEYLPEWGPEWGKGSLFLMKDDDFFWVKVKTDRQYFIAKEGDWIVYDDNELYVYTDEEFRIRYEI